MSQPNMLEFTDWLSNECLYSLTNDLEIAGMMNTDYIPDFQQEFAVGETIRVPYPQRYVATNGFAYSPQPINRKHTTVTIDQPIQVSFEWGTIEQALKLTRGREKIKREVIDPAMNEIRQQIESRAALFMMQNCPNIVGVLGTDPTTFDATSAAARQLLVQNACPSKGERGIFVPPAVMRALKNSNISYFNPQPDISKMVRTGVVGYGDGFEWHESVSLQSHTSGTVAGTFTTNGVQSGNQLTVNCTSGDVWNAGDVIGMPAGYYPVNPSTRRVISTSQVKTVVVATTTTASASTATIPLVPTGPGGAIAGPGDQYQNINALPANGGTLTIFPGSSITTTAKSGTNGLAFHRDAFALVGVPLMIPTACELSSQARDPNTGIQVAFVRMFDPVERKMINRFDCLIGFGVLFAENCAVRVLGA